MRGEQEINCLTRVKQNLGRNSVHYFCSDPQKIIRILKSARPNPAQSNFPDFLFENGFIEHFQITASRETRKGAEHRQRQAQFCKEAEQRFQRMGRELNDAPPANSLTREICEMEAPPYSYEMYEASFRKNWQHHIIHHQKRGSKVLLFVREFKADRITGGAAAYTFLGTANYVKHDGSRPINITWKLDRPIPAKFLKKTNKLVVG